ncbi:sn-1-specific diacylglycerol lipase ABHD11 isoform X2 [Pleurodeles waltl]
MTYEAMSADVHRLLELLHIKRCILIGHSMGGKTAMTVALQWPDLVQGLVSVDISPAPTTAHSRFHTLISAMRSVQVEANTPRSTARRLAEEQLRLVVQDPAVRQFLLTNLVEVDGQYIWRVNLDSISQSLPHLMGFPEFHSPYTGSSLFLGGANSPYIRGISYIYMCVLYVLRGPRTWAGIFSVYDFDEDTPGRELVFTVQKITLKLSAYFLRRTSSISLMLDTGFMQISHHCSSQPFVTFCCPHEVSTTGCISDRRAGTRLTSACILNEHLTTDQETSGVEVILYISLNCKPLKLSLFTKHRSSFWKQCRKHNLGAAVMEQAGRDLLSFLYLLLASTLFLPPGVISTLHGNRNKVILPWFYCLSVI